MQEAIIFGVITFIVIYLIYYFIILKRKYKNYLNPYKIKKNNKKKEKDIFKQMELGYLITKFNLDPQKIRLLYTLRMIALIDAFIISFTGTIIYYIPGKEIIWKFLIGFVLLFGLIYAIYELFGRHLVKKGWQK